MKYTVSFQIKIQLDKKKKNPSIIKAFIGWPFLVYYPACKLHLFINYHTIYYVWIASDHKYNISLFVRDVLSGIILTLIIYFKWYFLQKSA